MAKYSFQRIVCNEIFCKARFLRKGSHMHGIMQLHAIDYRSGLGPCKAKFANSTMHWTDVHSNSIVHGVD